VIDSQSALEAALTLLTSVQAGAHLIHDVGYMDNGLMGSLEQVTICNEIISWVKAYLNPIQINPETLALDAIQEVVMGGGDFMGSENTVKHFREDLYPKLISRQNYDSWLMAGGTSMRERSNVQVEKILAAPLENTLEQTQIDRIQTLVDLPA
jgi:trimethylamine--corrinoid protein Co-methyltransferase